MNVKCEKCGASYDMEDQQIPPEGLALKCPSCLQSFRINRAESSAGAPPSGAPDPTHQKLFVRRGTGSVFGPFVGKALETMARTGKLEGSEAVSLDNVTWVPISQYPGLGSLFSSQAPEPADVPDLPAPIAAQATQKAPPRAAIAPPPPDLPDLPAPIAAQATQKAPPRAAITPPPPDLPDLPAPRPTSSGGAPKAAIAPVPPELPDLPAPRHAGPGAVPLDLPDLPTPAQPDLPTPRHAGPGAVPLDLPDLPTPAQPDLPTPLHAGPGAVPLDLPDLPTPAQPDLPTPSQLNEEPDAMGWGELELDRGGEPLSMPGEDPVDLSELDLVTPFGRSADLEVEAAAVDDGAMGQGSAPVGVAAPREKKDHAGTGRAGSKPSREAGLKLLGMPRRAAKVVLVLAGLGVLLGVFLMLRPSKPAPKTSRRPSAGESQMGPTETAPRPSEALIQVTYHPALDLDTPGGYLKAAKAYAKKARKQPSPSLQAARAKALLLSAHRYGSPGSEKQARKLLKALGEEEDGEILKARALERLLAGKPKTARSLLRKAAAAAKNDPEIPLLEGWAGLEAGRLEPAERSFRKALALREKSAGARFGLARTLALGDAAGTTDERKKLLGEVLALSPLHAQALVAQLTLSPPSEPADAEKALKGLLDKLGPEATPRERSAIGRGLIQLALGQGALNKALPLLAEAMKAPEAEAALLQLDGVTRLQLGDARTAATRLEEALKTEPDNTRTLEALVRAYLELGQGAKAEQAVDTLLTRRETLAPKPRIDPRESAGAPEAPMELPRRRRRARPDLEDEPRAPGRKTSDPSKSASGVRSGALHDPYLELSRGRIAQARGEHEDARRLYLSSTSRRPDFTEGHAAYLSLLHEQRQYEGMRAVLELVRARYGDHLPAPLVILEGQMLVGLGKVEAAAKTLRTGSEREPSSNELLLELAACLWRLQKKPEEAFLLLDQVAKRATALLPGLRLLAEFHWERKDRDRAKQAFEAARKVLRFDALDRAFAELLLRQPTPAHLKRAKELLDPLLQESPLRDDQTIALHALVALEEGDTKEAAKRIRRALSIRPQSRDHRIIEARIAVESGDARQAILIYDALLKEQPSDLQALYGRARLLCRFRDTKRCISSARALLKRQADPEAHLLEGQGHLQDRSPAKAMRSFRKAIALDRGQAEAHFLLGRTLYDETNFRAAVGSLRQSLDLSEETSAWWPDIHYFLGLSYAQVKSNRLAIVHLKRYLATKGNPGNPETGAQRKAAEDALKRLSLP